MGVLTIELPEMTGQKFAICPSINSRWVHFFWAVRRLAIGTSSSSFVKPLVGDVVDLFCHVTWSPRKAAKFISSDKVYCIFCFHASYDVMVSCLVSDHCLGARVVMS